jgi:ATP-dependent Clp protease ATP-binding subunit ClpC
MHAFYDKITDRARRALSFANDLAKRKKHRLVTNLHLLWGLLEENQNIAVSVLRDMGVDIKELKRDIENTLGHGNYFSHDAAVCYNKDVCECICYAITIGMNEHQVISCHHLLLSLMSFQGKALQMLNKLNIDKELVEAYLGAVVKSVK